MREGRGEGGGVSEGEGVDERGKGVGRDSEGGEIGKGVG